MKIAIVYATTEGQTRKIVRFCADHLIDAGDSVEVIHAVDARDLDLARFDGAIVAGSIHVMHYQKELAEFAKVQAGALAKLRTLFLSVSLTAASNDPEDRAGLADCVAEFSAKTGWTPGQVAHVAGAFMFSEYDFFRSWAMRWIAAQRGQRVSPNEDREYTDWQALAATLDAWRAG
ncbi:flavodoxin domain-containing protein [Actibacterium sp. MT2.3-13A]|uniref:flavodoxin domain-containing protein n=1 Tax=Actibacterium sp. MT2.3-13A TaxID=2828332 RepID=UPI001BA96015|nr:flavodoxin domain-containing protein [Actibacterium sp. MT2.3-13A]